MFRISLFTENGALCNAFDYILAFTFLMMFHLAVLLGSRRERRKVRLIYLGSATVTLLLHLAAAGLAFEFSMYFEIGTAPGLLGKLGAYTWLFLPLVYPLLLILAFLPPKAPQRPGSAHQAAP